MTEVAFEKRIDERKRKLGFQVQKLRELHPDIFFNMCSNNRCIFHVYDKPEEKIERFDFGGCFMKDTKPDRDRSCTICIKWW